MSKPEFVYVIYIHAAPEKIWQALIDPEIDQGFLGPSPQYFGLEAGLGMAASEL